MTEEAITEKLEKVQTNIIDLLQKVSCGENNCTIDIDARVLRDLTEALKNTMIMLEGVRSPQDVGTIVPGLMAAKMVPGFLD